jgi:hypothetical protein
MLSASNKWSRMFKGNFRSFLLSRADCITETLPHIYDKFMTWLPCQRYPAA